MKKEQSHIIITLIALIVLSSFVSVQAQVSLESCIQSALNTHPTLKSRESLGLIKQNELENNKISKYPMLQIAGQGKYISDVVTLDIEAPFGDLEFPEIPHFQYNLSLNANQVLYDGGSRALLNDLIEVDYKQKLAGLSAREREIEEMVQRLYLQILLKAKQLEVTSLLQNSLEASISKLEAGVKGGVVSEMQLNLIKAERIDLDRKILSLKRSKEATIQQLSIFCNIDLDSQDDFIVPKVDFVILSPQRSEYEMFDYKKQSIDISKKMAGLKSIPKLSAFGQAGYGRPGLNMLSDEWSDFYIVGLQFSWIPWDYKEVKRKKAVLDINSQIVDYEKEAFDLHLQSAIDNIIKQISLKEEIIQQDMKMVAARESIRKAMEKRLDEGVITSSEYIFELNREKEARFDLEQSKLELLANQLAYEIINGK